ncbi:PqqD family peptide modification chaperone [Desulfogranum japonicum]|uniref:PqqD family peptide modification chaperone n=1 Tax=Desulfogranum japonicum TaxID=231447 RepID=UPI000424510A|nr:PqqD family peptide modification chaperone [Desulfogranum japonicum]
MGLQSTFSVAPDVIYQELDGEMVLLDTKSGEYFGIDEIGSRIWALIEQGQTTKGIQSALLEEYDVDEETCSRHVGAFVNELQKAGLIEANC